jgi:hypothetical protein
MTTRRTRRPPVRRILGEAVRFSRRTDDAIAAMAANVGLSFEKQTVSLVRSALL